MVQLINISDIKSLKTISVNLDAEKKLNPFILEAQNFDLKKLMGNAFYLEFINDFLESPSLPTYSDLFNGSEFTYCNKTIRHEGLKTVLAYLSYARYVLNSNVEATANGTVHKKEEYSEHVSEKTIQRLYDQAYAGAMEYWDDVKKFLNEQDYELWDKCKSPEINAFRISGVSSDCKKERRKRP